MKKLSIITPSYKSEKYLDTFLNNMAELEGFAEFEIILILNDASEKENAAAENFKRQYPNNLRIVRVPRESIAASTNRGFSLAETEYITCADVDDIKTKSCYAKQLKTLDENPGVDFTYGDFIVVPAQGVTKGLRVRTVEFTRDVATRGSIVGPNHFFRKKLLDKSGSWDEQLKSGSDFDFQIRAAFNSQFKKTSGDPLLFYTRYPGSNSASSGVLQQIERTVIELRYGIYDKIDYSFLPKVLEYDVYHVYFGGQKKHISELVPNYSALLEDRYKKYFNKGIRKNFLHSRMLDKLGLAGRYFFKDPVWTFNKIKSKLGQ
jgi:glycosyltransferase involved in cell wall biosynthesis